MNPGAIDPFVFAPDRFAAILAIAAFLAMSEVLARKVDERFSRWAWGAIAIFIVGARAGHVVRHLDSFLADAEGLELDHILLDDSGAFARHYTLPGLPATLFIGADGILQSIHMGEISREALKDGIARIRSAPQFRLLPARPADKHPCPWRTTA